MDRLTSLEVFSRVVETGGFSAAARKLNMSTTMVSNHVQALEDRLGVRLLQRTTRKVSLTDIGKAYYDRCIQILAEIKQADDIASELQSVPRGTLRIHVATHMVPFVAPVVAKLLSTYPELKIDLRMGEAEVDLIVRSLATWRHVLCCSHDYLERHGRVQKLDELTAHNCARHLNYPFGEDWRFFDRKGTPASVRISGSFITNSGEALRKVALEGAAVCLMAGFLVQGDLEAGRLVRLLPEYRPVEMSMNAVYPHRHHLSAKVRTFIDMLVHHSAEQQKLINPYS
jgi:DNA-binding transcriptional LysR family regulator